MARIIPSYGSRFRGQIFVPHDEAESFASDIHTEAIDYRYSGRVGEARTIRGIELEAGISECCRAFAKSLRMVIIGVDLRRTPDGEYYCFEVNPSPGFTFYQRHTGQRIGDALVDLLIEGKNPQENHGHQQPEPRTTVHHGRLEALSSA